MTEWSTIEQILKTSLAAFLAKALPAIGGEKWWRHYVLDSLTYAQARNVESVEPGDIEALDLSALIRVAKRSASELRFKLDLDREFSNCLHSLATVRDRHAHAPTRGIRLDDQYRDCDTVVRVLQQIGAPEQSLSKAEAIRLDILRRLADPEPAPPAPPSPGGDGSLSDRETADEALSTEAPARHRTDSRGADDGPPEQEIHPPAERGRSDWMISSSAPGREIERALESQTFVGIDFGTATTVVSVIRIDDRGRLTTATLPIDQPAEGGGSITHHLVNTVLAWQKQQLLFGRDAYRLRQQLFEGRNVFSSFKMRLGVDVGPTYPETALRRGVAEVTIESAGDATREFFRLLHEGLRKQLRRELAPGDLRIAVTVPASFEANQRRDLLREMRAAGLPTDEICLIDEPNAAFLSFLFASTRDGVERTDLVERIRACGANILVYDFGAGTCDVSILEVGVDSMGLRSRNRAISRFMALGGDDLDRAIARKVLLPQLLASNPDFEPLKRDVDERLVPRLQPTAERLKVAAIEWLEFRGVATVDGVRRYGDEVLSDLAVGEFTIRNKPLSLESPTMTLGDFADALQPFVSRFDRESRSPHVFAPVVSALEKSGLEPSELDAVLFVGGSAANPIVRNAVLRQLPDGIQAIVPSDLRSHVSLGAALHSFGFHAKGIDLVRPITSEAIYVVTRSGGVQTVIPPSTEVPTKDPFRTELQVDRSSQSVVEVPICVGSVAKLLGILRIEAPTSRGFSQGERVAISASITHDKLLEVEASAGGRTVRTGLLNPLANQELTPADEKMLKAKQQFNVALLESSGRPSTEAVLNYATAALEAEQYDLASEMFKAVEALDESEDHATNICYALSKMGDRAGASEWAKRAYERDPDATTAYNLAVNVTGEARERLLREAIEIDDGFALALLEMGRLLQERRDPRAKSFLVKAMGLLEQEVDAHEASKDACRALIHLANELGKDRIAEKAQARLESMADEDVYDEENLAAPLSGVLTIGGH